MPKRKRKGNKYSKSPIVAMSAANADKFFAMTDDDAPLAMMLAVGVEQHPKTKFFQPWISTNGLDFTCIAAYRDQAKALAAKEILEQEAHRGNLSDPDFVVQLFTTLAELGDGEPLLLPDEMIHKLGRDVLHSLQAHEERRSDQS